MSTSSVRYKNTKALRKAKEKLYKPIWSSDTTEKHALGSCILMEFRNRPFILSHTRNKGKEGIATSIGHSPIAALIDPVAGSRNSITEALTNIIWAPLQDGLLSVSLSANWMWPCKNKGEDARLYKAVEAVSDFSIALGINVPTGKDSLSMKQKYKDGEVLSPGTVIISAAGHCQELSWRKHDATRIAITSYKQHGTQVEMNPASFSEISKPP